MRRTRIGILKNSTHLTVTKHLTLLLFFSISWGQLYDPETGILISENPLYDPETGMLVSENPCEYERYLELLEQFWGDEFELWSKSEIVEWKILSRKCDEYNREKNIIDSALVKKNDQKSKSIL